MVYFPKGYALTDKQKLFCDEFLSNGFDGYKAAKTAGYSEKRALSYENKIMELPRVKEYINHHITEARKRYDAKQKQGTDRLAHNLQKLDFIIDKAIPDILPIDDNGNEIVPISSFEAGMKAIDMQAKLFGHYAPVKQANLNINVDKREVEEAKSLMNKLVSDNTKDY